MQAPDRLAVARALFVAAHVVLLTMMALPEPAVSEEDLAKPDVQGWFRDTAGRLSRFGWEVDGEGLQELVVPWARRWQAARHGALSPGRLYARACGVHQSWRMFAGVSPEAGRLRVDARLDGTWSPAYRPRSGEHAWRVSFFEHERVRTLVNQFVHERHRSDYRRLGRFLAARVTDELGPADAVRLEMEQTVSPEPEVLRAQGELTVEKTYWSTVFGVREATP
ncbi:MAG: hypothetical protein KC656_28585 [Myxococcales bacterium]|nr:hypothetical protein [Myxococcales bacterium]